MDEYHEYYEYRSDRFVKLKNGEVVRIIPRAEKIWEELDLEGYTETRNLVLPFSLAVLAGLIILYTEDSFTRSMVIVGYICFSLLFFISLAAYTIPKMKIAGVEYIHRKKFEQTSQVSYFRLILWVLVIWPIRMLFGFRPQAYPGIKYNSKLSKEFGQVLFFWVMVIFWGFLLPLVDYFLI
jgi:hypothetical protein